MEIQWSLVLFTVIAGAGAWTFAASVAQALLKKGDMPTLVESIVAAALLAIGGVASVTHLSHVERIFEALNRPASGIFVEAALVGILIALMAVYCIMIVRGSKDGLKRIIAVLTMLIGIVFSYMCGHSYMMVARQAWMTQALPLSYCMTCAITGAGLNMLMKALPLRIDLSRLLKRAGKHPQDGEQAADESPSDALEPSEPAACVEQPASGVEASEPGEPAACAEPPEGGVQAVPAAEDGAERELAAERAAISFAGLLTLVLSALATLVSAWFFIQAAPYFADAKEGLVAMTVLTFVAAASAIVAGCLAFKLPRYGRGLAVCITVAGIACSVAMRCGMWLVGTPVMDVFMIAIG